GPPHPRQPRDTAGRRRAGARTAARGGRADRRRGCGPGCDARGRAREQRECRAARRARRHRAGTGAAHRRIPRRPRRLRLARPARRGQRHRPPEARVPAHATGTVTGGARADEIGTVAGPWLAAALAAPALAASGPIGIVLVVLAPLLLRLHSGHLRWPVASAAATCLLLGSLWSLHGIAALAADPLRTQVGDVEHARLVVEGQPRPGPFGSAAIARLDGHLVELRARGDLQQGAIVKVGGRLAPVPPPAGGFDRRTWLARQGVHETLTARSLAVIGMRGGMQGVLDRLRRGAHAALRARGDDESSRIATGVALGGTAALDEHTVEEFRTSGLAHLLAVSG